MLTFLQFLTEKEHEWQSGSTAQWGIVHPETGHVISGNDSPVHTHPDLKKHLGMKSHEKSGSPEFLTYHHSEHGTTLHVRSYTKQAHQALHKSLKHLPLANHFEHDYYDRKGNSAFKTFHSEKDFHKHVANLAR